MKSISVILFLLLGCVTLGNAQINGFGIRGGYATGKLDNVRNASQISSREGYSIGLFVRLGLAEKVGLGTELSFTTRGAIGMREFRRDSQFGVIRTTVTDELFLNYLDLPFMVTYRPVKLLEFHAGWYTGFLLKTNLERELESDLPQTIIDLLGLEGFTELEDSFKSTDVGLLFGLVLHFEQLSVGTRYNYGLARLARTAALQENLGPTSSRQFQFYLAVNIK